MISIAACGLSFFIGFVIGISFFALCRNELELEMAKHRRTMDALIKLQKQVNIDKESKNDVASMVDVYDALLSGELKTPKGE